MSEVRRLVICQAILVLICGQTQDFDCALGRSNCIITPTFVFSSAWLSPLLLFKLPFSPRLTIGLGLSHKNQKNESIFGLAIATKIWTHKLGENINNHTGKCAALQAVRASRVRFSLDHPLLSLLHQSNCVHKHTNTHTKVEINENINKLLS